MNSEIVYLSFIFFSFILILAIIFYKKINDLLIKNKVDTSLMEWLKSMQQTLESTNKNLHQTLNVNNRDITNTLIKTNRVLNERLDNAATYISQVAKEVGKMSELGKSMADLQLFLQSPKLRGNLGEQILTDMLSQSFPKSSFYLQYSFRSGDKVDAAIKTSAGILPIDAKFPMSNFRSMVTLEKESERQLKKKEFLKDIKKHIDDISKKYILPDEGTLDFAFMYLPSETVFYEFANNNDLLEYAREKRIYPVSPNTLYIHLQAVLLSYEGQKIETRTKEIFRILRGIQKDYQKTETAIKVLGRHINNAYNQLNQVMLNFGLIGQKLSSTKTLPEIKEVKKLN